MPIYHFHSDDGERFLDAEGHELANDQEARLQAVRLAGEVLAHNPDQLWKSGHWRIEVTDENDELRFTIITLSVDANQKSLQGS